MNINTHQYFTNLLTFLFKLDVKMTKYTPGDKELTSKSKPSAEILTSDKTSTPDIL